MLQISAREQDTNIDDTGINQYQALATICAEHTRRLQLLFQEFYCGTASMHQYRKRSRELTQWLVDEVSEAGYTQ